MRVLCSVLCAVSLFACAPPTTVSRDGGPPVDDASEPPPHELRIPDRAVVELLGQDARGPWWIEERIQGQPVYVGDHDLGPRSIVRAAPQREVVWTAPDDERLTDATLHPSGEWSAVGVDDAFGLFLARGDGGGAHTRIALDDPELATDRRAWIGDTAPTGLLTHILSEASPTLVADGEDVVVMVLTRELAVIAYRWHWRDGRFVRGTRTLLSPARSTSPFLAIGGSYDDFDAVASPFLLHAGIDDRGRVFVTTLADRGRIERHNAVFGTHLELLRDVLYPRESTQDALVIGLDRDGSIAFATVVGTLDVEDEIFGLAVGADRVAVLGRSRRELGRDNTELHVMVAELDHDGVPLGTTTFDSEHSGLAQSGAYAGDTLYVGGTEGWTQNPSGRSVFTPGHPFLVRLSGEGARTTTRLDALLPETEGHAELRALWLDGDRIRMGGHERGPLTHTGDADRSLIRSDAYWVERSLGSLR